VPERPARLDSTSGQASHHAPHRTAYRSPSVVFFQHFFSHVAHHHLACFSEQTIKTWHAAVSGGTPERHPVAPDGFLRQQRSHISAVRAKRLTTAHHAPSQKVKVLHPLLLRGERDTKAHGAAAAKVAKFSGRAESSGIDLGLGIWRTVFNDWVYQLPVAMKSYHHLTVVHATLCHDFSPRRLCSR
jgi:hypothetical protein